MAEPTSDPVVTVLMPVFNSARFLRAAIESAFQGVYPDRQQAFSIAGDGLDCAGVQVQPAADDQVVGEPLLACAQRDLLGMQERAQRLAARQTQQYVGFTA